jgi:hypothetical protein
MLCACINHLSLYHCIYHSSVYIVAITLLSVIIPTTLLCTTASFICMLSYHCSTMCHHIHCHTVHSYLYPINVPLWSLLGTKKGGGPGEVKDMAHVWPEFLCSGQADAGMMGGAAGHFPLSPVWACKPLTHSAGDGEGAAPVLGAPGSHPVAPGL